MEFGWLFWVRRRNTGVTSALLLWLQKQTIVDCLAPRRGDVMRANAGEGDAASPTRRTRAEAFLQPGPAIGIVRPQGQFFQQQRHVVRNRKARRIDRSAERRGPDPPQEPSAELQPVEPQRR